MEILIFAGHPRFAAPIANVTVPIGREATLVCVVEDLGPYKVSAKFIDIAEAPQKR